MSTGEFEIGSRLPFSGEYKISEEIYLYIYFILIRFIGFFIFLFLIYVVIRTNKKFNEYQSRKEFILKNIAKKEIKYSQRDE